MVLVLLVVGFVDVDFLMVSSDLDSGLFEYSSSVSVSVSESWYDALCFSSFARNALSASVVSISGLRGSFRLEFATDSLISLFRLRNSTLYSPGVFPFLRILTGSLIPSFTTILSCPNR